MASQLETLARETLDHIVGSNGLVSDVEWFAENFGKTAGVIATAGESGTAVEAGESAGVALVDLCGWPVLLVFFAIVLICRLFENVIVGLVGTLVFFNHSGGRAWARARFRFIDNLENRVLQYMEKLVAHMLHSFARCVLWVLGVNGILHSGTVVQPRANPKNTATEGEVQYLQREINKLQSQVGYLTTHLGTAATTTVPSSTIPQQVHYLEHQVDLIRSDLHAFSTGLNYALQTMTQLENRVSTLSQSYTGIRHEVLGLQDMGAELDNVQRTLTSFQNATSRSLDTLTSHMTHVWPLTLLLQPGISGLRNLRKLEDNICQCPKFGGIPNELGTALAVMEYVENG